MTLPELAVVRDEVAAQRARGDKPSIRAAVEAAIVETGIPVPPVRWPKRGGAVDTFRKLAVGQSVLLPGLKTTVGLHGYWKDLDMQFVTRTVAGGVRVWRVK